MPHADSSPKVPHVLILGAGLGGLAVAQVLRKQNVPFSIFEASLSDRPQGWAIGLHTVIKDLIAAMPDDLPPMLENVHHLLPFKIPSQICFYPTADPNFRIGVTDPGNFDFCRANRYALRKHLALNIPVQYGKVVTGIKEDAEGVTATFEDGTTARGDVAIAADGVHSVIRKQILTVPDPQQIIPIGNITGEVTLSGDDFKRMLQLGHSAYVVRRPNTQSHFFAGLNQVHPDGKSGDYYWFMVWHDEEVSKQGKNYWTATSTKEELHKFAQEESLKFDPLLSQVVRDTPVEGIVASQIFRGLMLNPETIPVGRTVLIGDAAHSMTPFRGEGGIHALLSGLNVAKSIIKIAQEGADLIPTLRAAQIEVCERGNNAVRLSSEALEYDPEKSQGPRMFFGHPAKPVPPENIVIDEIPFVTS